MGAAVGRSVLHRLVDGGLRLMFPGWAFVAALYVPAQIPARPVIVEAMVLARDADQAAAAGNPVEFLDRIEAAVELRPDVPRFLLSLAMARAVNDLPDGAVAALERLADLGLHARVERTPEFAGLRTRPDFATVARRLAVNGHPAGTGAIAFTLRDMTGLIAGIAWREKTGEFYFGDGHARAIWTRGADGRVRRFDSAGEDGVFGIFGLLVDEEGGALWAATSAVPEMRGYSPGPDGAAGIAEFDLATGALRRLVTVPEDSRPHLLGDLAQARDGTLFATDGRDAVIWRLDPRGDVLERWVESDEFVSLEGIVVSGNGEALLVADRVNGLLRVDRDGGEVEWLPPPASATLVGIESLARTPDGDVVAIQASTSPKRVLRLKLDRGASSVAQVTVLDAGHLNLASPGRGCLGPDGDLFFIANTGQSRFSGGTGPTAPRPVAVFQSRLSAD